jgi:hypothetical protein
MGTWFGSQHPHGGLQLPVTLGFGTLMPPSDFQRLLHACGMHSHGIYSHGVYTHTHTHTLRNTHAHKIKANFEVNDIISLLLTFDLGTSLWKSFVLQEFA